MSEPSKRFALRLFNKDTLDEEDMIFCVELDDYARRIGVDVEREPELLQIAAEGMFSDLPAGWQYHRNLDGDVFYYNDRTYTATHENPIERRCRQRVLQERVRIRARKGAALLDSSSSTSASATEDNVKQEEITKLREERAAENGRTVFHTTMEKVEKTEHLVMSQSVKRFAQHLFNKDTLDKEDIHFCVALDNYARRIGIDPECEPELLHIAAEGISTDLPFGWHCQRNLDGDVFFYNYLTYMATRENPIDKRCRQRVVKERKRVQSQSDFSDFTNSTCASACDTEDSKIH